MEIETLKVLLGISPEDKTQDAVLCFILEDVEETVKNYCNCEEMPEGLNHTGYRMAIDLYRYERPGEDDAPVKVASISEGDTSTSFTSVSDALEGGVLKDYRGQLNRYRKVMW